MNALVRRFLHDETAAAAIEYALIITFIALVIISAIKPIGSKLNSKISIISNGLS